VAACPNCGRDNAGDARFCSACGTELGGIEPAREQRKVVTVLFCDLVGSTALGESTDPEVVRARLTRTFEDLRVILERHGGTVEKFVGDAVMAVFGIPVSHEDDALRAVRAAAEMRAAIAEHGLEARIGVNTGEVVVGGEGETLVTGDAVNVAARLEQAAGAGEVFIGAATQNLVRDAVRVEAVEPLALKGKSELVEAFRLVEVSGDTALARHLDTPLVGRERERQRIWRAYEDAIADRSCQLFTLLGPAGIGKSRLVADFLERVGDQAEVLRGRCLSYGEGITYWPLVEILVAIGVEPDSVIGTSPPETQLGFRRLLESRAAVSPQVVVIDDLQWAEPVFVDLVEHVADLSRDAPIFLLCVARTELLDGRPGWGGGKMNATSLLLEPLNPDECVELMGRLVDAPLDDALRQRIAAASAGNPLYVEEMLAMVREHGGEDEITVPSTIQALLQARIDSLDGDVRVVMERGSVEGEVFHRGAVAVLSPDPVRGDVESHLTTLVRKELIRSTSSTFPQDEGYRFRHLLIRDAAYESLSKATRAELHEKFAEWLAGHDLVESDEIVGYHLEQAHRYRLELDQTDFGLPELAMRAATRLATAGYGAIDRGDLGASRSLLKRARALLPELDPLRARVAIELAYVLSETGELQDARAVLDDALASSDPAIRAQAVVADGEFRSLLSDAAPAETRTARRAEARAALEKAGDDFGLARYWLAVGYDGWAACQSSVALESWERGLRHARAAGAVALMEELRSRVLGCLSSGPVPVTEAVAWVEAILEEARGGVLLEAAALRALGRMRAMEGRLDEAREDISRSLRTTRDAGSLVSAAGYAQLAAFVERRAGDVVAEERCLREGLEELERLGDRFFYSTVALELAGCLVRQENVEVARALCGTARERTLPEDTVNFIFLNEVESYIAAKAGDLDEGERLARQAVDLAETTDFFQLRGMRSRGALAEILALRGETDEAATVAAEAIAHHENKGDVAGVAVLRKHFADIGLAVA
jgi:class 3 adenylate cyclase/tetratricopeptide (TPR) repeat protein